MKNMVLNPFFKVIDFLLTPFMWILGGFATPLQETHRWHIMKWKWQNNKGLIVKASDKKAKFDHTSGFGLFHMPIFGGLTKYVVIEAKGFDKYWRVGWSEQIHLLKIKQNQIKLLVGKNGFIAYGLGDNNKDLKLRIIGFGELGDKKYNGIRLF